MSIMPLPVFEADADPHHREGKTDAEVYDQLEVPKSLVVRFGRMGLIGEYPYDGDVRPGCGTKLVARTHRGTELVEMVTTTCKNTGCSKSISTEDLTDYVGSSGGKDFPLFSNGRILRIANDEDVSRQTSAHAEIKQWLRTCADEAEALHLKMIFVAGEPILGGELLTFYFMAEERVDFRELVRHLASEFKTRIELRQVGARDEARLVADFERCGQECCCKRFLKQLKPVSMRSAKLQKATLDPLKISGRCGRLMCCLRYEDQTYKELKANLPHRKTRVGTTEGPGIVVDGRVIVQLVLVRLEHDQREIAVPVDELLDPDTCPRPWEEVVVPELPKPREKRSDRAPRSRRPRDRSDEPAETSPAPGDAPKKKRRRGRRRKPSATSGERPPQASASDAAPAAPAGEGGESKPKRRRRRRRRKRGGGGGGDSGGGS